jgi:glycosyltransferase involved in cell wall biosynthesis
VAELAKRRAIPSVVLMDRPPDVERIDWPVPEIAVKRRGRPRVIVPCSYDNDEPLDELQKATFMLPGMDFYFTWYKEKLPERFLAAFKDNAIFLGFLPLPQFNALLAHGDVILVLTSRLGTQPSGASEALAFEKPLVVSDLKIIRSLFPTGCIYVKNNASDIARGVECALDSKERLAYEMRLFKIRKLRSWEAQFEVFNNRMRRAVGSGQRCGMQESSVSR